MTELMRGLDEMRSYASPRAPMYIDEASYPVIGASCLWGNLI